MKPPICPLCGRRMKVKRMDARHYIVDPPHWVWYVWHDCDHETSTGYRVVGFCAAPHEDKAKAIELARTQLRKHVAKCLADLTT